MRTTNMDAIKVQVKDLANFFNYLDDIDYRILADFYDEDGFYIGKIDKNCASDLFVSDEVRAVWRNDIKFSKMYTLQETVMLTFIVLKGEEKCSIKK